MKEVKEIINHYKHNPEEYWFKRAPFGWGWVPVRWQGWLVFLVSVALISGGIYISQVDDAPGVALLGIVLAAALTFGFGRWKGEKACFQWGLLKRQGEKSKRGTSAGASDFKQTR